MLMMQFKVLWKVLDHFGHYENFFLGAQDKVGEKMAKLAMLEKRAERKKETDRIGSKK